MPSWLSTAFDALAGVGTFVLAIAAFVQLRRTGFRLSIWGRCVWYAGDQGGPGRLTLGEVLWRGKKIGLLELHLSVTNTGGLPVTVNALYFGENWKRHWRVADKLLPSNSLHLAVGKHNRIVLPIGSAEYLKECRFFWLEDSRGQLWRRRSLLRFRHWPWTGRWMKYPTDAERTGDVREDENGT